MNIKNNIASKLLFSSVILSILSACEMNEEDLIEDMANNASQYEDLLKTGINGGLDAAYNLVVIASDLKVPQSGVSKYDCERSGTLEIKTEEDDSQSQSWLFNECSFGGQSEPSNIEGFSGETAINNSSVTYDGRAIITHYGDSQTVELDEFKQTINEVKNTSDGIFTLKILEPSETDSTFRHTVTSSDLKIELDSGSLSPTEYVFESIYYYFEKIASGETKRDLDFKAYITDIGRVEVSTYPILEFDKGERFLSGTVEAITDNLSAKMVATGSPDIVNVSLDSDKDGAYGDPVEYNLAGLRN